MRSPHEEFFQKSRFAVIGNSAKYPFPKYTYRGLKECGKIVFAVDPSSTTIEGDASYMDLTSLPSQVEAVILELPKNETATWVTRALDAGIRNIWIHMETETPEAVSAAVAAGAIVHTGTCAVMYVLPNSFPHNFHRWIMQRLKKY